MGLFSSKKKIYVSSCAFPILQSTPDPRKEAVTEAFIQNKRLTHCMLKQMTADFGILSNSAFHYAKNHYTLGTPEGSFSTIQQVDDRRIEPILEELTGNKVFIDSNYLEEMTVEAAMLDHLLHVRKYEVKTGYIKNHSYTLKPTVIRPLSLHSFPEVTSTHVTIKYDYSYRIQDGWKIDDNGHRVPVYKYFTEYFSETVPIPDDLQIGELYLQVTYWNLDANDSPTTMDYWYYLMSSNEYPELNADIETFGISSFMPIIPIRRDNRTLTHEKYHNTELYKTSRSLLNRVKVDIDQLGETLDEMKDSKEIDHAYVMWGVPLSTDKQEALRYLVRYFDYLAEYTKRHQIMNYTQSGVLSGAFASVNLTCPNVPDLVMQEYGLNLSVSFGGISSKLVKGKIGKRGFVKRYVRRPVAGERANRVLVLEEQKETNAFLRVCVCDPVHKNTIYRGKSVTTDLGGLNYDDPDDEKFLIPVNHTVISQLSPMDRQVVYAHSFRMVVNSYKVVKTKWYQNGIFTIIIQVIGIVCAPFTGGQSLWATAWATAAQIAIQLLIRIVISIVIKYAFEFIAEEIGGAFAMIFAAILVVVGTAMGMGGMGGDVSVLGYSMPTADIIMTVGSAGIAGVSNHNMKEMKKIQSEMNTLKGKYEEKMDALEEIYNEYVPENPLDINLILDSSIGLYSSPVETPRDYYQRTIHSGNTGVTTLKGIRNFVPNMLNLPKNFLK